ncbi:MAG: thioredoxin family protein [Neomegalonema sp.]|nr:thioredoxin family protein [Neomegalonema sp.]
MRLFAVLAFWAALLLALPAAAVVSPEPLSTERTYARLIADIEALAPGEAAQVALDLAITPGWHTYWRNPGDSGMETTLTWSAPEGVEIGEIRWPTPHRNPVPPMMNYGYEDRAVLTMPIRLPEDWPLGEPVVLSAQVSWLVCADICIPEDGRLTLTLPTAAETRADPLLADLFAQAQAAQPVPVDWPMRYEQNDGKIRLLIEAPELTGSGLEQIYFFPHSWGVIDHAAPQEVTSGPSGLVIEVKDAGETVSGALTGVFTAQDRSSGATVPLSLALTAQPGAVPITGGADEAQPTEAGIGAIVMAALLALGGGLILNLMPCVFPVLALKALSFAKHAKGAAAERSMQGLAYGAGVLVSFLGFAALLLILRQAGAVVGWGFQLQTPIVVAVLAYLLFVIGLNLAGVFEVPSRYAGIGGSLAAQGGVAGSFFTGVLAALVASPCTAPFMGAALGFALTQSAWVALVVFAALGVGFALPIVLLAASPSLARLLPQPGPWMARFRTALAFPMFAAAAWLLWVLGNQAGIDALFAGLIGMVLLALALWALGMGWPSSRIGRSVASIAALLSLIGAGYALAPSLSEPPAPGAALAEPSDGLSEPYAPARLSALRAEGRTVFINLTADWCISCKVNERVVLKSDDFANALHEAGAVYLKGDWTRRDAAISDLLAEHGRVGVPLYLVYRPNEAVQVLPQILTQGIVREALLGG